MANVAVRTLESPVGQIEIHCSENGLRKLEIQWSKEIEFSEKSGQSRNLVARSGSASAGTKGRTPAARLAAQTARELKEYFAGRRRNFSVPLDMAGTAFQKKVWQALAEIPYGEVRSYGQIASQVGNEKASRAVGTANGANPVAIIVPCHRVIAGDGTLGGYGGGLRNKTYLLSLEKDRSQVLVSEGLTQRCS